MSFKAVVGTVLALVFAGSVVTRSFVGPGGAGAERPRAEQGRENPLGPGQGFLPGQPGREDAGTAEGGGAAEVDKLTKYLPLLTEASFFGLIGFALGYFSRKVVKIGLILIGVGFIAAQGLSYLGIADVRWDRALELVNQGILNLKENQSWKEVFAHRIPSMGALVAGYILGFRKG